MRSSAVLVACAAVLLVESGAINCALPEPLLHGARNGSAVAVPATVKITSAYPPAEGIITAAIHNGRPVSWDAVIEIASPGTHRIVVVAMTSDWRCERADLFVFATFDVASPSVVELATPKRCGAPETHLVIFSASMDQELVQRLVRVLSALSAVTSYQDAEYHVALRRLLRVEVDPTDPPDETWWRSFNDDLDASISDNAFHSDDSFSIAIVEDFCPVYAFDLARNQQSSLSMLQLRSLLHGLHGRNDQLHVAVRHQESQLGFDRLFGTSNECVLAQSDQLLPAEFEYGLLASSWGRILSPVDATVMLSAFLQTEWHHFQADVPSLHAELGTRILDLEAQSTMDTIHRAAFLGVIHIALVAHLPADTKWYRGVVDLQHISSFRVINENSWRRGSFQCLTIREAAARMNDLEGSDCSMNCSIPPRSQSFHAARVHQLEAFTDRLLEKPIVVVSARLAGPFTILDGNHRAIALERGQPPSTRVPVIVGLSSKFDAPHEGSFVCT